MKWFPWIALAVVLIILALRGCKGPADHSKLKHRYDSATTAGGILSARLHVRESELATLRQNFRTFQKAANAESDSLENEATKARRHPKVVEVVREVPAVATAFYTTDKVISFQKFRIRKLEADDSTYKAQDSLFHVAQDTLLKNKDFINQILRQDVTELKRDLKKQSNPFSIGFSAGPGVVVGPDGKVNAGLALSVGLNLKIRRRR